MENTNLSKLLKLIKDETGVSEAEMATKCREKEIVWSRYLFAYFAKNYLNFTDRDIYRFINIDRTTLIHVKKKHDLFVGRDKEYTFMYNKIKSIMDADAVYEPEVFLTPDQIGVAKVFNKRMLAGIDKEIIPC